MTPGYEVICNLKTFTQSVYATGKRDTSGASLAHLKIKWYLKDFWQDTLSKAREVALRILQNTVYQMVEQIPQVQKMSSITNQSHKV